MATKANANSRGMHPWWWDSHISRKNSRWLQENLTDMDAKVKAMRKLIEEDADSFARRAEMYYKKRPELMELVDEFYLAYRALAERYDRATGALSQAQQTITEAFPNQVPMMLADESPVGAFIEAEPYTPDRPPPVCAFFSPDELEDGVSPSHFHAVKNGAFTEEFDSVTSRKGLKQLNDLFGEREVRPRVRKSLNFKVADESQISSAFAPLHISENEVQVLKEALAKLKANDANPLQCQQSLERVSNLDVEVSRAQEDSSGLKEQARNVEAEVHALKDTLTRLESEREAGLLQYQQCLERIQNLENSFSHAEEEARELNERANKAESESQSLKEDLYKQEAEKDAVILRDGEYLETISNLENKLLHAEEEAAGIKERADEVEVELKKLKHVLAVSTEEKDAAAVQCQQYLEKISKLEEEIFCARVEAQRLNGEIDSGIIKLNGAEEQCHLLERSNQSLHSEVESLVLKLGAQGQELSEKQQELGRLWTCIQEDRLRFVEAETVIQTLQHMHSESQEELRSLAVELQNGDQMLKDMVACNQGLQDEIKKIKEENRSLNELNLSSADSVEKMQNEMYQLRETRSQLEEEVGLRIDQRNALQQEIYCLKEEINDLNRKLMTLLEQIDSVGLNPESFGSTVKELQNDNSMLRETCQNERSEKVGLLVELEIMEKVLEKNTLLEKSLSDLGAELEGFKMKSKALEESHQSLHTDKLTLVAEKGALLSELHIMSQNLDKLSEKNTCMENSLSDAQVEHEGLKEKLKSLEDLCHCLEDENFGAITARDTSMSQFEVTQQRLEDLEERHTQLEERNSVLEKDNESALQDIELLSVSLDVEKKERATFTQSTETRLTGLEAQIRILQEESRINKISLEEELDNSIKAQLEIFILQKSVQELEEKNLSLLIDCQEFVQMSKLSEKLISELRHENHQQEVELKSLNDQIKKLMMGMSQIHKALDIESDYQCADENSVTHVLGKLEDTKSSLCRVQDENQQMHIEYSILEMLLEQLSLEVTTLEKEKSAIYQEFRILTEQSSVLWSDIHKFMDINKELKLELREGDQKVEVLSAKIEDLYHRLSDLQGAYQGLKSENFQLLEEKRSLMKEFSDVIKQKDCLEEEHCAILGESFSLSNLSLILMNIISGNSAEQKKLAEDLDKLRGINLGLGETVRILEVKLENLEAENSHLNESLEKSENELNTERSVTGGLSCEITYGKDLLCQKELKLLEAEQKLTAMQHEKKEWNKIIADIKMEYNEANVIREDQEKHMLKLAHDNYQQNLENECLRGTIRRLDADLYELHKEKEDSKIREENLNSDLSKEKTDVKLWEDEAVALFGELQVFAVREALLEEKIHEFNLMCGNFQNQSNLKDVEIELLKDRVNTQESENEGLKSQLASFEPAITALRVCIASLQDHTLLHPKSDSLEEKEVEGSCTDPEGCQIPSQDQIAMLLDGFSNLQEMQARIVVTEKAMIKMERLAAQERSRANGKLEAAMREIVELESQIKLHEQNTQTSDHGPRDDVKQLKTEPEICVVRTKDIIPDQLSESPSVGMGMKNNVMAAKQDFELWETADQINSSDLKIGEDTGTEHPENMVEKEVGVDKIEICASFRAEAPQDSNRGRILERLTSDSQRLENLEITVQDLKKKVDSTDKSKVGKDVEYDSVKVQLEEAETAIQKLIDITARLMKITQDNLSSPDGKLWTTGPEESGSARKRVLEQARRGSEKIGRLQLEVQKLQFMLVEHDEKEQRAKTDIPYRRRVLREYLYGDRKTSRKQKGAHCCACVRPQTKGD